MELKICKTCKSYTLREICKKCNTKTSEAHYKFLKKKGKNSQNEKFN